MLVDSDKKCDCGNDSVQAKSEWPADKFAMEKFNEGAGNTIFQDHEIVFQT